MPIFDACIDAGIRLIHTRHEGATVYMAEAYSQLTGEVAIAMVAAGPAFASSLGPLYTARSAESPIVLLSGDSPIAEDGKGCFQELDQVSITKPLTKFSLRPKRAENLGFDIAMALRAAASGRPGPVHVALPFDLLNEEIANPILPSLQDFARQVTSPSEEALQSIVDAVESAKRPVILTGPSQNPTRAKGLLEKLADAMDAPVIPMESPRGLKDPCLGDFATVMSKADVIVSLGKNIDFSTSFGQSPVMSSAAEFLVVDPETEVLERAQRAFGKRMTLGQRADANVTVQMLAKRRKTETNRSAWRAEMSAAIAVRPPQPTEAGDGPMHPAVLCAAVQRLLDDADDPILIADGGEFGQWSQACISAKTRVINGLSGSIGGALCYAVAAKIARPDATVVALMGDGTVGFHFAEFETAYRYGTDFIAVIGHDSRWNAEYQIQLRDYGVERLNECELNPTRYDLAAIGFGCHGEHVTDPAELDVALKRANKSGLPTCFIGEITGLPAPSGFGH